MAAKTFQQHTATDGKYLWSTDANWGGSKPVAGDTVTIGAGLTCTLDDNIEIGTDSGIAITINGTLEFSVALATYYSNGQADQLAIDAAAVLAVAEYITTDVTDLLGVAGTLDITSYTPTVVGTADIDPIITEWGELLTIKRSTKAYGASGAAVQTWATQSTFSGDWQPGDGRAIEVEAGRKVVYTAKIITSPDVSVVEGDQIHRADGTFEYVVFVKKYRGHITIYTEKTRGAA